MASDPITHFDPDPERLAVLRPCMGDPADDATEGEWETTLVSRRTVVYGSGAVARAEDPVRFAVNPDELALCRRLTAEADGLLAGVDTGLGSESTMNFRGFFVAGDAGDPVPDRITPDLVRGRFGGALFPPADVEVEPLAEGAAWWDAVLRAARGVAEDAEADYEMDAEWDDDEEGAGNAEEGDDLGTGAAAAGARAAESFLAPWRGLVAWFQGRSEFSDRAFVKVGDYDRLADLLRRAEAAGEPPPDGMRYPPSNYPRMFLGLTPGGSLVGLFGSVVYT